MEDAMKKLQLEALTVESFETTPAAGEVRGAAAHQAAVTSVWNCPYSFGGTCAVSVCQPCYTDDPCN
jgi:hypothetical protein